MSVNELEISRGDVARVDREALARLAYEPYALKARHIRVNPDVALGVIGECLDLERCFVARRGMDVVGLVGLIEPDGQALRFSLAAIRRHFGRLRSLLYFVLLNAGMRRKPRPGEVMFQSLVVSPEARNEGIGKRLVQRVEEHARAQGYSSVGLDVTDTNPVAIGLYERMGYRVVGTTRYGRLTRGAGFSASHHMTKRVTEP